jgi:hypothetical protein
VSLNENDFFGNEFYEIGQETESDFDVDYIDEIADTVLWSSDWTVETIVSSLNRNSFNLDPNFQRRNAWNSTQKSRFIESLIFGLPIPQVVLAEVKSTKGQFIVVDGKQRLLTLMEFFSDSGDFKLTGLKNVKINGLSKNSLEQTQPQLFQNLLYQPIRSVIIRNWPSENFLFTIFYRLNTGSLALSTQELRKALKPGAFVKFVDDYAGSSKSIKKLLNLSQPDPRMRDVDLVLRYISFATRVNEYRGNYKEFIDFTCDYYNTHWVTEEPNIRNLLIKMEMSIEASMTVFGSDKAFRRKSDKRAESRVNRAMFDVITYYFSMLDREKLIEKKKEIHLLLVRLQNDNYEFIRSISLATNGKKETQDRFKIFGQEMRQVFGQKIQVPIFD